MNKSKLIVLAVVLIGILATISGTYAIYVDSANTRAKMEIANWIIKVNSADITLEEHKDFTISDIVYNTYRLQNGSMNSNNKFAPGMEISFTVAIDATESMVALEYDMDIDLSEFDDPNIVIKSVTSDNGSILYDSVTKKYHGKLDLARVKAKAAVVTVTLKWLDNDLYQEEDNALGSTPNNQISVPVDVVVNQYVGA